MPKASFATFMITSPRIHPSWRAVDQDGDVLDILVQSRKDKRAAKRLFRKLLKRQERVPIEMTTRS